MFDFDRFDIAEAYYMYFVLWNLSGLTKRCHAQGRTISAQLSTLRFKPRIGLSSPDDLTENGRAIYDALVERYATERELAIHEGMLENLRAA